MTELVLNTMLFANVSHLLWVANGHFAFSSCYDSCHWCSIHRSRDCRGELLYPWCGGVLYM